MNDYKFGNFLCMLREQKGMTQAELAQQLSVTPAAVSKWENGESKPRIETLFTLAEILGVSAQELMNGELEPEQESEEERRQRRQKEFADNIDLFLTPGVRHRRSKADMTDWALSLLPFLAFLLLIILRANFVADLQDVQQMFPVLAVALLAPTVILIVLSLFVFRDVIGKGRSFGYKKQGLVVIDRKTGEKASNKQLILRNIFFFLFLLDDILIYATGEGLGDRITGTCVVFQSQLDDFVHSEYAPAASPLLYGNTKKDKRKIEFKVVWFVVVMVFLFSMFFVIRSIADSAPFRDAAIAYLINSEAGRRLQIQEEAVQITGFTADADEAEVRMMVGEQRFTVICHKENDKWVACADCTEFE